MLRFNQVRGIIGGVGRLSRLIGAYGNARFPAALQVSCDAPWMPAMPIHGRPQFPSAELYLEAVEAPLTFSTAARSLKCDACGWKRIVVVFNASFLAMATHLLSSSRGSGLPVEVLVDLIQQLFVDPTRLRRGPHPENSAQDVSMAGILWITCHEIGHMLPESANRPGDEDFEREVYADHVSIRILAHRALASGRPGQYDDLANVFDGAELILRTLHVLECIRRRRVMPFSSEIERNAAGTPTPAFRAKLVRNDRRMYQMLLPAERLHTPAWEEERWSMLTTEIVRGFGNA